MIQYVVAFFAGAIMAFVLWFSLKHEAREQIGFGILIVMAVFTAVYGYLDPSFSFDTIVSIILAGVPQFVLWTASENRPPKPEEPRPASEPVAVPQPKTSDEIQREIEELIAKNKR